MKKTTTIVFVIFGLAYIFLMHLVPFPGHFILKAIPALSLAFLSFREIEGRTGKVLALGFLFSAGGDIALSFLHLNEVFFIVGLGLFLTAHVLYIVTFSFGGTFRRERLPFMLMIVVLASIMIALISPNLGELAIPVYAYIFVITLMNIFAINHKTGGGILIAGAFIFMLSDSMIAIDKFLFDQPQVASRYIIMTTYYLAQYLIIWAFLKKKVTA